MTRDIQSRPSIAIVGRSSLDIEVNVVRANRLGFLPRFVSVITPSSRYSFSPFAPIVRTKDGIAVSSFGFVYLFPTKGIRVYYMGDENDVPLASLPFGAFVERPENQLPAEMRRIKSRKAIICPDCTTIAFGSRRTVVLQQHWEGLKDPWQTSLASMKIFDGSSIRSAR